MARKKTDTTEEWIDENIVSPAFEVESDTTISETKDPLADKVHSLRARGFDNNRIAAMLMISRHTIDKI